MRHTFPLLALSASVISLMAGPVHADITVSQANNGWEVTVDGDPLSDVLEALRDAAGFRLVGAERLVDNAPVTAEVSGDLGEILGRLLAGYDYALVYGDTPETETQLQRLVLLSGRSGEAPDESQRLRIERVDEGMSEEDGARVSDLLQRQVQPLIDAENAMESESAADTETAVAATDPETAPPAPANPDDDYELDPETQAALAEATRRAQQDLQALVNALRAAENSDDN